MLISDLLRELEQLAPLAYQESYDNAGLSVGDPDREATAALLCFDVTEEIVDEAVERGANLIISHHPVIFSGLKRIGGQTATERIVVKAIKHDIALYAAHTNLDSAQGGVSWRLAEKLGLTDLRILSSQKRQLIKLVTFVPTAHVESVQKALFEAGAGHIGQYDSCSFTHSGVGSFRAGATARPFVGAVGELHREPEVRIETVAQRKDVKNIVKALLAAHPYEEVAYDIYPLENALPSVGLGVVGNLPAPCDTVVFLERVKGALNVESIRSNKPCKKQVARVAVCGGSGSNFVKEAIAAQADVFITGDCKYHQFIEAEGQLILADIGHFESESFAVEIFYEILSEKFPNFVVYLSKNRVNPVYYF